VSVFVCGALHYDVIVNAPHLPRLDETVAGETVRYAMGGKGGNQAVAAARMGARTTFAGRIGDDASGATLLESLNRIGIDSNQVQRGSGPSGMSVAIVEPEGGYGAVIVSAANLGIDPNRISIPDDTKVILLQNEIPEEVNYAVAQGARNGGAEVVLNAAPARQISASLLALIDVLVVNRVEAAGMLETDEAKLDPISAAQSLSKLGPKTVIITLGGDGLALYAAGTAILQPGHPVQVVSTHGAGDAFLGALAAARDAGKSLALAARFGQAAAALHVSTEIDKRKSITRQCVEALIAQTPIR